MLVVLLNVIYIAAISFGIGALLLYGLNRIIGHREYSLITYVISGAVTITVFVEFYSIIGKIGAVPHIIMLLLCMCGYWLDKKQITKILKTAKKVIFSWEGLFYVGFVIFLTFFASRGEFHTDTNIYHAAAIRMYEEYGLIKGMGNLQLHYAYNSSSIAFASIFSLNWLFGTSIHATTCFFEVISGIYALYGLKRYKEHEYHLADASKVGILLYVLVCLYRSMSPATDYATLIVALMVISLWCDNMERDRSTYKYALLSVLAVFVMTMKFSACILLIITIYPLIVLIRNKNWREIVVYLLMGVIVVAPFLARNVIISGYLLYPVDMIDWFNVEWKIPLDYMKYDADQIKVWGKCLFDVQYADMPVREWLPVWIDYKERYELMLLYGICAGTVFNLVYVIKSFVKKIEFRWESISLYIAIMGCLAVWFFEAPFIRYGLAFIFAIILIPLGWFASEKHKGLWGIITGVVAFGTVACITPYFNNYITDMGVFIKQNVRAPYYIEQKPYDDGETSSVIINGNTIYYCSDTRELNSYYHFPNTCYYPMLERTTLIGDTIEDGFKPKWG